MHKLILPNTIKEIELTHCTNKRLRQSMKLYPCINLVLFFTIFHDLLIVYTYYKNTDARFSCDSVWDYGQCLAKRWARYLGCSGQVIWRQTLISLGDSLQQLKLEQDDPEAETLGDGMTPTQVIENMHLFPRIVKFDVYTKTVRLITNNFDVTLFVGSSK